MNSKVYRKGVFALIRDSDGKFLVIQKPSYNDTDWALIGGGAEDNEDQSDALLREIQEETSLTNEEFEVLGRASQPYSYDYPADLAKELHGGKYTGQSYDIFLVALNTESPELEFDRREIAEHKWIPEQSLESHLNFPGQYEAISRALDELNET